MKIVQYTNKNQQDELLKHIRVSSVKYLKM